MPTTITERNQSLMNRVNSEAVTALQNGNLPWVHAPLTEVFAYNGERGNRYNLLNQLCLPMGGAYYTRSAIIRMNEQNGVLNDPERRVSWAGQTPYWVRQWFPVRNNRNRNEDDDEEVIDTNDRNRSMRFTATPVFHASQLTNLPANARQGMGVPHVSLYALVTEYMASHGIRFTSEACVPDYQPTMDKVYMPDRNTYVLLSDYLSDLVHEVAHATGCPSRLNRWSVDEHPQGFRRCNVYDFEELVCEIATATILARWGMAFYIRDRTAYEAGFLEYLQANNTAYSRACTQAERIVMELCPEQFPRTITATEQVEEPVCEAEVITEYTVRTCACCGSTSDMENPVTHFGQQFCSDCATMQFPRWRGTYAHLHNGATFHGRGSHVMGIEIETSPDTTHPERYNIDRFHGELSYLSHRYDGDPVWHFTTDCTINNNIGSGIECVTHPATLDWWMEHSVFEDFHKSAVENGFFSHDSVDRNGISKTGLHVHVNRAWLTDGMYDVSEHLIIGRIMLMLSNMERNESRKAGWSVLDQFARRQPTSYCAKTNFSPRQFVDDDALVRRVLDWSSYNDRYHAINLTNRHTIEFRFPRGTTNPKTIKATLQFISNLVEFARSHDNRSCHDASFADVVNYNQYDELTEYARKRRLL